MKNIDKLSCTCKNLIMKKLFKFLSLTLLLTSTLDLKSSDKDIDKVRVNFKFGLRDTEPRTVAYGCIKTMEKIIYIGNPKGLSNSNILNLIAKRVGLPVDRMSTFIHEEPTVFDGNKIFNVDQLSEEYKKRILD